MIRMRTSGENLARSEARKCIIRTSPFKWAGLDRQQPLVGIHASFTPASPLKRVFYWARFHQTAKRRQRVRNPRFGLLERITRGMASPTGKRVMAATDRASIPALSQPGGSLIQAKLTGQTSKPELALGKLAPCCQDDEQKALDKIDESLGSVHIHRAGRQPKGYGLRYGRKND